MHVQFLKFTAEFSDGLTDCSEIWGFCKYGCEVVQEGFKIQNIGV